MPEVKIKCRKCQQIIGTKHDLSKTAFHYSLLGRNSTECPHCGEVNLWGREDVINKEDFN